MELKILRQDVSVNSEIFKETAEQSIDIEMTLPEYFPKISKILKCKATPHVGSASINGQILAVEGTANILLLYSTAEDSIFSYEYALPFRKNFECGGSTAGALAVCTAVEEYLNCRVLAENKVELHGAVGLCAKLVAKKTTPVITDIDGGNVLLNRGSAPATTPVGMAEKYMQIDEELELSGGQPSINSILRYCVKAVNTECKIISGKAVIKGEIRVFLLYCGEHTASPQTLRTAIPYSQIIEVDGLTEECQCAVKAQLCAVELKPRTSVSGEARSISMQGKVHFTLKASCNNDIPVILDAFSTKYETKVVTEEIVIEKIGKSINDNFVCRKKLDLSSGNIGTVIDIWGEPRVISCKTENGEIKVSGEIQVCILAYDTDNTPAYFERVMEFEHALPLDKNCTEPKCEISAEESKLSFTILNSTCIEVTAELTLSGVVYEQNRVNVVQNIEIDDVSPKNASGDTALIIYYAGAGESVWNIARRYNSSPAEICEINTIEGGIIDAPKTLLIPVK